MEDIPLTPEQIAQIEAIKAMENTTPAVNPDVPQVTMQPDPVVTIQTPPETGVTLQADMPVDTSAISQLEAFLPHIPEELKAEYLSAIAEKFKFLL
jgi:hypothetical protein